MLPSTPKPYSSQPKQGPVEIGRPLYPNGWQSVLPDKGKQALPQHVERIDSIRTIFTGKSNLTIPVQQPVCPEWWWWEISGLMFSATSIAGMVGLLVYINHMPLDDWPFSIAPNSLLSVLSTLANSALLIPIAACISQLKWVYYQTRHAARDFQVFDEASRGPWGGVKLLFRIRDQALLACIGGLITILCLAVEPSTQQVLSFSAEAVGMLGSNASVGRAQVFDLQDGSDGFLASAAASTRIQTAVLNGLLDFRTLESFNCPTTSCTWPSFVSLALCTACTDVISSAKTTILGGDRRFDTPSGFSITVPSNQDTIFSTVFEDDVTRSSHKSGPMFAEIVSFAALNATRDGIGSNNFTNLAVNECTFRWCILNYTEFQWTQNGFSAQSRELPVEFKNSSTNAILELACNGGPSCLSVSNRTFYAAHTGTALIRDQIRDALAVNLFFSRHQNGSISYSPQSTGSIGFGTLSFQTRDLSTPMKSTASALTGMMRNTDSSEKVYGRAISIGTVVIVRWVWLAVPMAVVLAVAVYLCITVWSSSVATSQLWKASTLPLLLHCLGELRLEEGANEEISELSRRAKNIRVKLTRDKVTQAP